MTNYFDFDSLTVEDKFPYIQDERYRKLLVRFMDSKINDTNEFIVGEAIQIYADAEDDNTRLRILELLKDVEI